MDVARPIIEMKGIVKKFGGLIALDHVDLELWPGECLALVGENAAGKSTLIKVLSGIYRADEGRILMNGNEVTIQSRQEAKALGIEVVYQELALVDTLDIAANVFLGNELTISILGGRFHILNNRKMYREAQNVLKERLGVDLEGRKDPVFNFSGGQRQAIAIARAIYQKAKVLILDEPTASLGVGEAARTFDLVRKATAGGVAVIWIGHNLEHIFAIANRILVLRGGKCVGVRKRGETTKTEIVGLVVGELAAVA
jgi:ABC-type sugar transport system ATPase subunit